MAKKKYHKPRIYRKRKVNIDKPIATVTFSASGYLPEDGWAISNDDWD